MKIKISILVCLLFTLAEVSAQTYYYTQNKTMSGQDANSSNTYTYQCVMKPGNRALIYNVANTKTNAEQKFKNGSPLTESILMGHEKLFVADNWTWLKCRSIVNNALSAAEKQRVKDTGLSVCMTIDTSTGKVIEVDFSFLPDYGFGTIPLSVYRKIELELKNNVWFTLTDVGKSLNFIKRSWRQEVE